VFASHISTARSKLATDGGYHLFGGELNISRISGRQRLNLTLRARTEDELLESERGLLQPEPRFPYDLTGNIIADPLGESAEIDPLLSAAAGQLVTVAGVPLGNSTPGLASFASTAGQANQTDLGRFRTLRPTQRNYEATLNANQPVATWLTAALTARVDLNEYESLQGLRAGLFAMPADSAFSPFSQTVVLARYFEADPLAGRANSLRGNLGLALNATRGPWQITTRGDYRYSRFSSRSQRQIESPSTPLLLDDASELNPFADDLGSLISLYSDRSVSKNQDSSAQLSGTGPLLGVPAGSLRANFNAGLRHVKQAGLTDNPFFPSRRSLDRDERFVQGSLEVPLTSREANFLGTLGDLSLALDSGITEVADLGSIRRSGYAVNWRPLPPLTLQASVNRQRLLPETEQLGEAVTVTDSVRYFDVVTGETVDVTQIAGGNPDLLPERVIKRRLSATAVVLPSIDLQLNTEFLATRRSNPISTLPPTSVELIAAFPERFTRAADGRLVTVDARPLNFVRLSSEQVRWGLNFTAPLVAPPPSGTPVRPGAPRPRLQGSLSHTVNLREEMLAKTGFPIVDLLNGGAVGFGGGSTRHIVDGSFNLSDREVGVRLNASWRSSARLNLGSAAAPSELRFAPIFTVSMRVFADLHQLVPREWLKDTRVSINVSNVLNERQRVTDGAGTTPLRYQAGYRDPVGRTIEFELRRML
jgi:hypothetical protein